MNKRLKHLPKRAVERGRSLLFGLPRNTKYEKYLAKQRCCASHTAHAEALENGVKVTVGPSSFYMRDLSGRWRAPPVYDFVAFALSAISQTMGWKISLEMPVSSEAVKHFDHISNVMRLWSIRRLSSQRLEFLNVAPENLETRTAGRLVCLSGGIDSTYAGLKSIEDGSLGGFLLIAGADYPSADDSAFFELRERVSKIASVLGRDLNVVETSVRPMGFNWVMLHGFNLASCLSFYSSVFSSGGFALDNTVYQDVIRNPWGNNAALPHLFSTGSFPIKGYGERLNRVEKLARIHEFDPSLIDLLSVCWKDSSTDGNCGHCIKCVQTRLAFHAIGVSDEKAFISRPPLGDCIDKFQVEQKLLMVKGQLVSTAQLVDALPAGPLKTKLREFEEAVRKRFFLLDPNR